MGKALQNYLTFWKAAYQTGDPWEAVKELDGPWPDGLKEALGDYALLPPEPFYGFLNDLDEEARTRDVLMLFINPGHVDNPKALAPKWKEFHTRRYLEWTREDYLLECGVHDRHGEVNHQEPCSCPISELYEEQGKGCQWRRGRYREARNNLKWGNMRFLHTMEYSFYHSDRWSDLAPFHHWISERPTTKLAWDALREIAEEKLVSRIVTIGVNWRNVLLRQQGAELTRQVTYSTERGGYSHRFYQFSLGKWAVPIVSYISGAGVIRFPEEERAVQMLDHLTEQVWDQEADLSFKNSFDVPAPSVLSAPVVTESDPCDIAGRYLELVRDQIKLPAKEYAKTGIMGSSNGKFKYFHFAQKNNSVWDLNRCMMKLRVYCGNNSTLLTRVEFGFSQDKVNLSEVHKDYLRGVLHQYAKLHGLMEYQRFPDKQFYNVFAEIEGYPEAVLEQTVLFCRKLLKAVQDFIDSIGEDNELGELNDRS